MDEARQAIKALRFEIAADQTANVSESFRGVGQRFETLGKEMKDGFDQLADHFQLMAQRSDRTFELLDRSLMLYEDHERRLQALESRSEPAA